jgi:hypothetical protein
MPESAGLKLWISGILAGGPEETIWRLMCWKRKL